MIVLEGAQLPASSVGPQFQKIATDFILPPVVFVQSYEEHGIRE